MIAKGFMHWKVLHCRTFFFATVALLSMLCSPAIGRAQVNPGPTTGEALHYAVTYEWGPIYLEVGEVIFSASQDSIAGAAEDWNFQGWGTSMPNWDWFYPVNSMYASTTDGTFLPKTFSRIGREGRHRYHRVYAATESGCVGLRCFVDELEDTSICPSDDGGEFRDVLSAIHWCRQLPWSTYRRGDVIAMELLLDGEVHSTTLEFAGKVQYLASNWPDSVACWEFHPTLIDGTVFKPGDEMKVLMTADERRLPVFIETELIIGAAKIHLTDHQIHEKVAFAALRDSCARVTRNLD